MFFFVIFCYLVTSISRVSNSILFCVLGRLLLHVVSDYELWTPGNVQRSGLLGRRHLPQGVRLFRSVQLGVVVTWQARYTLCVLKTLVSRDTCPPPVYCREYKGPDQVLTPWRRDPGRPAAAGCRPDHPEWSPPYYHSTWSWEDLVWRLHQVWRVSFGFLCWIWSMLPVSWW